MAKKPKGLIADEKAAKAILEPPPGQSQEALNFYTVRLNRARDERAVQQKEYSGNTFEMDYERNREAAFSYLRPKKNDDDVRVNSGTAEKKIELMVNELLSMNFQPEVRAFDRNDVEMVDLGMDLSDAVKVTNEQEKDEDMFVDAYIELLTQRAVFFEERIVETEQKYSYAGKEMEICKKQARKFLLSALQVYLADLTIPAYRFQEQPYVVIYDRMLYSSAKNIYGENKNWKHVKPGNVQRTDLDIFFKYRFGVLEEQEVEIITYMSKDDDEYQVIINGVMMFEPGTPMPCRRGYPMTMTVIKPVSPFKAYGKPPIDSAKFLASLQDETLRNMIYKFRQAMEPPLGTLNGKVYGRDVFAPGAITQGLGPNAFTRIVDHDGVTSSEFAMFQLINSKVEEFIGAVSINNPPGSDKMTATQVIGLQKQALKMLGLAVLGAMRMKRDLTYLRLDSIMDEYVKPIGKRVDGEGEKEEVKNTYRLFETIGKIKTGETVKKYIQMVDRQLKDSEMKQVHKVEKIRSEEAGMPVKFSFLNVEAMAAIPLNFFVTVSPESRDSSSLDKVLFQDKLVQAAQISQLTGRQLNAEKTIDDFERTWKSRGMFAKGVAAPVGPPGSPSAGGADLLAKVGAMGGSTQGGQIGSTLDAMVKRQ